MFETKYLLAFLVLFGIEVSYSQTFKFQYSTNEDEVIFDADQDSLNNYYLITQNVFQRGSQITFDVIKTDSATLNAYAYNKKNIRSYLAGQLNACSSLVDSFVRTEAALPSWRKQHYG